MSPRLAAVDERDTDSGSEFDIGLGYVVGSKVRPMFLVPRTP